MIDDFVNGQEAGKRGHRGSRPTGLERARRHFLHTTGRSPIYLLMCLMLMMMLLIAREDLLRWGLFTAYKPAIDSQSVRSALVGVASLKLTSVITI